MLISSENGGFVLIAREGGGVVYWLKLEWLVCCSCCLLSLYATWTVNLYCSFLSSSLREPYPSSFIWSIRWWHLNFWMLGENNTVLNLEGLLRTSGKRTKSPGPRMDEVDPWLLFRSVLTHCWFSEEDSKCLGTTTTSGESLAAAQEKKIMLTQRHLSGVNSTTGTLWPPRPRSDPARFSSHSPCQAGDASLLC